MDYAEKPTPASKNQGNHRTSSVTEVVDERTLSQQFHQGESSVQTSSVLEKPTDKIWCPTILEKTDTLGKRIQTRKADEKCLRNDYYRQPSEKLEALECIDSNCAPMEIPGTSRSIKEEVEINSYNLLTLIDFSEKEAVCGRCQTVIGKAELCILLKDMIDDSRKYTKITGSYKVQCEICTHTYNSISLLQTHLLDHAYNHQAYCIKCQREISTLSFQSSVLEEEIPKPHQNMSSAWRKTKQLSDVCLIHSDPPQCGNCGEIFDYISALVHKMIGLLPQPKASSVYYPDIYICRICQLQHVSLAFMKQHILKEIRIGNVLCKKCQIEKSLK